ncbi:hypothetical protein HDU79_007621 [Rhizoclosmatium sp. JEL0117]|nr:hypothetical protein HDU79_007621 [Rhizoclosmatium sp. JEL0117]
MDSRFGIFIPSLREVNGFKVKEIKHIEQELEKHKKELAEAVNHLESVKETQTGATSVFRRGSIKVRNRNAEFQLTTPPQKQDDDAAKLMEAQSREQSIVLSITNLKQRLKTNTKFHERLVQETEPLAALRSDLVSLVAKYFFMHPSTEESYFSKQLDHAIDEFFIAHKDSHNLKTAAINVHRGVKLLKQDKGVVSANKDVDIVALEDIIFSLHFLQLANTFWPNLRSIAMPDSFDKIKGSGKGGSQRDNWAMASERLNMLKAHLSETADFLKKEQKTNIEVLNSVFMRIMDVSDKLKLVRFKMMEAKLMSLVPGTEKRTVKDSQWKRILEPDINFMKKVAVLDIVVKGVEEIGRAVGQIYVSSFKFEEEFAKEVPAQREEMQRSPSFTIVIEAPYEPPSTTNTPRNMSRQLSADDFPTPPSSAPPVPKIDASFRVDSMPRTAPIKSNSLPKDTP